MSSAGLIASVSFLRVLNISDDRSYEPTATAIRKIDIKVNPSEYDRQGGRTTNLLELVKRAFDRFRAEQYPEDKDEIYHLDVVFCGLKWETRTNAQLILKEESLSKFDASHRTEYFLYYRETKIKRKRKSLPGKSGSGSSITRQKRMVSVKHQNFARLFVANVLTKLRHQLLNPPNASEERLNHFQLYTKLCRGFLKHIDKREKPFPRLAAVQNELCHFLEANKDARSAQEIAAITDWIQRNFEELCTISTTGKWIDLLIILPDTHERAHEVYYFDDATEFEQFITDNCQTTTGEYGLRNVAMDAIVDSNLIVIAESVYEACVIEEREKERRRRRPRFRRSIDGLPDAENSEDEKEAEERKLDCSGKFCTDDFHVNHPIGMGDYPCVVSGEVYTYLSASKMQRDFESERKSRAKKRRSFGVMNVAGLHVSSRHRRFGRREQKRRDPKRRTSAIEQQHDMRRRDSELWPESKRRRRTLPASTAHSLPFTTSRTDGHRRSSSFGGDRTPTHPRTRRVKSVTCGGLDIHDFVPSVRSDPWDELDLSEMGRTHSLPANLHLPFKETKHTRVPSNPLVRSAPLMGTPLKRDDMCVDSPSDSHSLSSNASAERLPLSCPRQGTGELGVSISPHEEKTASVQSHLRPNLSLDGEEIKANELARGGKLMQFVKNFGSRFHRNAKNPSNE